MDNWIIWLIISAVLMIVEMFTPAFLFGLFSAGALITAIVAFFIPDLVYLHILIFAIVSFLLVVFIRKIFLRYFRKDNDEKEKTNMDAMIGIKTIISETVINDENKGAVMINDIRWRVIGDNDDIIDKGEKVRVVDVKGSKLIVRKVNEE